MGRAWGIWTKGKLDVLRRYLDAFTTATKFKAKKTIYIDAFAGEAKNRDRLTGEALDGSARIALSVSDPPFSILRFFESERNAPMLESVLRHDFPDRDFKLRGGDSNELVPSELELLKQFSWAPTFAFIDPNGMEAKWKTLVALADFKKGQKWKAELFYLFSPSMFQRLLRVDGCDVHPEHRDAISAVFGTSDWDFIYSARLNDEIAPANAREDYVNLMRWRMESVLGYKWTHPLEVRNERGNVIYHMIFATDHEAGHRIMSDVYARAAAEFPAMREEARKYRRALKEEQTSLFDAQQLRALDDPIKPGERFYEHEPPSRPWFLTEE